MRVVIVMSGIERRIVGKEVEMPLTSVAAVFDGQHIRLLEAPPVRSRYRVVVTFLEPTSEQQAVSAKQDRFWDSFGAWADDRPIEATLQDIHAARKSKTEPPAL